LLQRLAGDGHVLHKCLALGIEAHPGSTGTGRTSKQTVAEVMPYLAFSVFDERSVWLHDEEVRNLTKQGRDSKTLRLPPDVEEQAPGQEKEEDGIRTLPWCFFFR
jgi:hypothetical protein